MQLFIFWAREEYEEILKSCRETGELVYKDSIEDMENVTLDYAYDIRDDQLALIKISGYRAEDSENGKNFYDYFRGYLSNQVKSDFEEQGKIYFDWLKENLLQIIQEIDKGHDLLRRINPENRFILIHWGGGSGLEADKLINEISAKERFPFRISFYSSRDNDYEGVYNKLAGKIFEVKSALEFYRDRALGYKKKLYELMESILIRTFPEYLKTSNAGEGGAVEILDADEDLVRKIRWLKKEEAKMELQQKYSHHSDHIESFYGQNHIEVFNNTGIRINNIKKFRSKFRDLLYSLPGDIYPKPL